MVNAGVIVALVICCVLAIVGAVLGVYFSKVACPDFGSKCTSSPAPGPAPNAPGPAPGAIGSGSTRPTMFVAVAYGWPTGSTIAASSTDGINWTPVTMPSSSVWYSVTVNSTSGVFVAVAYGSRIAASSVDGINWTPVTMPSISDWNSVTVNPTTGVFVAIANNSSIAASSTDGINWTPRTLPGAIASWYSVACSPTTGVFVAVANNSSIAASSTDGIDWTPRVLPVSSSWQSVTGSATVSPSSGPNSGYMPEPYSGKGVSVLPI